MPDIKDLTIKHKKGEFACPMCKHEFPNTTTISGHHGIKKGQIFICSHCAMPSVLGDTSLHPMTKEEFASYPKGQQVQIASAATNVKKRIADTGESFNPFSLPEGTNGTV